MTRPPLSEAEVEGRPPLVVADEDREALAELIADMLDAHQRDGEERPS